jgi:hypothetical protein
MTCRTLLGTVLIALATGAQAFADPPERVARVSFLGGATSMRTGTGADWAPAAMNYPLTVGDEIWTDRAGRLELTMGATAVDLDAMTNASILNLDHHVVQLRVVQGTTIVRVRELGPDESLEIDTPNSAVTLLRPGVYRIDVASGDSATVTVRRGDAEVTSGPSATPIHAGQTVTVSGLEAPAQGAATPAPDEFDDWALSRDRRIETPATTRYVSRATVGYEDLDEFGSWNVVAEYGPVWIPHVQPGWAPYRAGHWAWVSPWGWTWIDDAPWGFAPFHYGRWAYVSNGWVWVPGTIVARPVYAPALVAFVGGPNWHVGASIGTVGWFPLGPREAFVPAYTVTPAYVAAMNRPHVVLSTVNVNVTTITYVNRAVPGAVTAVSRETFVQARPVSAAVVAVTPQAVSAAVIVGHAAPREFAPVVATRSVVAVAPPVAVASRAVVVRTAPPAEIRTTIVRRTFVSAPAALPPRSVQAPAAVPAAAQAPPPAAVTRVAPDRANAELAARHAQERADVEARHAAERAEMKTRHDAEAARAAKGQAQAQVRAQQAHERADLDARQKGEHEQLQKKQEAERKR